MSNILKLVKFDFYILKPYLKKSIILLLFPILLSIHRSILEAVLFCMFVISMISSNLFEFIEKNNIQRIYGILPVSKRDIVIGRYTFAVYLCVIFMIFSLISSFIVTNISGGKINIIDVFYSIIYGFVFFSFWLSFTFPFYYKFGAIKGKIAMTVLVFSFFGILIFIVEKLDYSKLIHLIVNLPNLLLLLLSLVFVIIMYIISIKISIKILKNKEF